MKETVSETNTKSCVPTLIDTTLDIIKKRFHSASSTTDSENYKDLMLEKAMEIWSWYPSEEKLFYDGFMHEGCFLLAWNNCFGKDISISSSCADIDRKQGDFILGYNDSSTITDVTISWDFYAKKLGSSDNYSINPILLPIYKNSTNKTYVELFLEEPTKALCNEYFDHLIDINEKIINNRIPKKIEVKVIKKKGCEKSETISFRKNSHNCYSVIIHKNRFKRITELLSLMKKANL